MKVKVYDVADLLTTMSPDAVAVCGYTGKGPNYVVTRRQMGMDPNEPDFSELMDVIQAVVEPDSWDDGGEMMEMYDFKLLVIRQTDAVHDEIERLLSDIRETVTERKAVVKESSCKHRMPVKRRLFSR